jgi:hypothetical protein
MKPRYAIYLFIFMSISMSTISLFGQCSGGVSGGALAPVPGPAFQTMGVLTGRYYTFVVPAFSACTTYTYTFSLCAADGGSAGFDSQITILDNAGVYAGGYSDDFCGLQSSVTWVAPAPGTYRVLINDYFCLSSGTAATLAYRRTTNSGIVGPYCLTDDAIPIAIPGYSNCAQMTAEVNDQRGCIWNVGTISFANPFDYTVMMYFGNNVSGADGCTFSFQNSPAGVTACGTAGGSLGMGGVPNAVVIEYDTYDNDNPAHVFDLAADHTAIEIDGSFGPTAPLCGPVQANPFSTTIDDGILHAIRVTWNPGTNTLSTYFDGNLRLACVYNYVALVFGGNPNVYWGFTGATGGLNNQQYFCPVNLPLPVSLIDFTASCNNHQVSLDWVTASEVNNSHFEIERSNDAIHYELAGRVLGNGTSNEVLHYQFTDTVEQQGDMYYRLKQVDFNGETKTYDPVVTSCGGYENAGLEINYGLITNYGLLIDFTTAHAGTHEIKVFDMQGNQLANFQSGFGTGTHQQSLVLPQTKAGIYLLVIENAENIRSKKLYIQSHP